ncbi:hypothetical protein [Rhizobium leguminosarum]|uniref:hypothetical protein n=1 Tax=Rhizobium leguminosarum TaxID=384 RepID=UPI00140F6851|nr:hypothetical protein [Rhizobium leguminosarum]QIO58867.1 hypothetical protein HA463_14710 [Rhizobium leguminosarum bv. trifolii]
MVALPQTTRFGSVKVTLDQLKRLWRDLDSEVQEQRKIEQHNADVHIKAGETDAALDATFRVACIVTRSDNHRDIFYTDDELVLPPEGTLISFVVFTNVIPYKEAMNGAEPYHQFEVLLDFTQPGLLDASTQLSEPTANPSGFLIGGSRSGWRAGIESAVKKRIKERNRLWSWFHLQFIYDLFLLLLGMPFALYLCWRLAPAVDRLFGGASPVVIGGAYVYIGFVSIWLYRVAFSYTRWAFPKVELADQNNPSKKHRFVIGGLLLFIVGSVVGNFLDVPLLRSIGSSLVTR